MAHIILTERENFYWRCFLAIEKDFLATRDYVEIHKDHADVYSLKYRSIILQACSEIEMLLKILCGVQSDDHINIIGLKQQVLGKKLFSPTIKIKLPLFSLEVFPWKDWEEKNKNSPIFWSSNNHIKHQGKLGDATQKNTIDALAGWFAVLNVLFFKNHGAMFYQDSNLEEPHLFHFPRANGACVKLGKKYPYIIDTSSIDLIETANST